MTKTKQKRVKPEKDSTYFLKLVLLLILGSMWLKVTDGQTWQIPIPVGLILGLLLVMHEHFRIDRKIEYAILLVAALVGFWLPIGIYVTL
ncbi:hypothetical protein KC951_00655 [Candidatus Saccharibacteria bacterium]|nr:hypothetical protein [Candidatus Saccharibacteria bacterium]